MNGIETLRYLNKKYANNGVKFEDTGTADQDYRRKKLNLS